MKQFIITTLVAIVFVPTTAFAQISVGENLGSTEENIRAALEAKGYQIAEIEFEGDEIELDAILNGARYEIEVSNKTGTVLEVELENESSDD